MIHYDYLIVGSGLFGATFAYRATKAGKECLVIDKRPQLGGNVYCEQVEGINVHKYGAHIFHTSNKEVWDFVNSIVEFNRYTNCPVANYRGELYNLPFNMNTFNKMWPDVYTPAQATAKIEEQKAEAIAALNGREPQNLEEQALCLVGRDIFHKLIKEYTEKQWGRDCKELPAFIIRRLPVRMIFDNNYFNDKYQGIPVGGYNRLIEGLLAGVDTITGVDFFNPNIENAEITINAPHPSTAHRALKEQLPVADFFQKNIKEVSKDKWRSIADKLVYTGAIDEYFGFKLGKLDWRTVSFKTRIEDTPNYQGNAVINYTSKDVPYTRVIEHKHFEMFGQEVYDCPKTVVSEEYSEEWKDVDELDPQEHLYNQEPYYPVNDDRNNAHAEEYRKLAEKEDNVIFGGRLGKYKYFDMAQVVEQVLNMQIN